MVTLTVWDSKSDPPEVGDLVYHWSSYEETSSIHSLLRYVEVHATRLRRIYTSWIHDLGESQINGKSLVRHLAIEDGLSYWWMTSLAVQDTWESVRIVDVMRLFAVEEIVAKQEPGKIRLVSGDRRVCQVLKEFCRGKCIAFEWQSPRDSLRRRLTVRSVYEVFPHSVRAIISFVRYVSSRWPFGQTDELGWFPGRHALFICSYFDNLDLEAAAEGRFDSHYWTGLPDLLNRRGYQGNWLQMFVPCSAVPNASSALTYIRWFNERRQHQGSHNLLDRFLSWSLVLRVLQRWLVLNLSSRRLDKIEIEHAFCPQGSQLSLWPLMRQDWLASTRGRVAMSNMLSVELFDLALQNLPYQSTGLYLCEGQAWERALVHAWRKHAHGRLIGVAHSTVRFWDLRYFPDHRTLSSISRHAMPRADVLAVNGMAARRHLTEAGFKDGDLADVEALRYGYLNKIRGGGGSIVERKDPLKVLIAGDFKPSSTIKMLRLLEAAVPEIPGRVTCTIKPHPNCPIRASDYPSLNLREIGDPLRKLLQDFHIICLSNTTSAAADAYCAGLPLVVLLDESELNFSPLRGQLGVRFVSTSEELAEALRTAPQDKIELRDQDEFFFLDPELSRWSHLLEN